MNRRQFLSLSALAGAGVVVAPQATLAAAKTSEEKPKMPTRILGKTGMEIPILSMGVMRADNPAVVRAAYNSGITHFDTAHGYQRGKNEEMLGAFFKDKDRSTFTIATKIHIDPNNANFDETYQEMFNTSLKRLQMDYVDIFYAHAMDNVSDLSHPKMVAFLTKLKAEGKIKHIGFSTHANKPDQIDEAIKTGIYEVILISYNFKLGILAETNAAIQRGVDAGIGFIAMKTMTGGVEDPDGKQKIDGAACLRWAWQNPNITTAIPGFTSFDLLDNCLEAGHSPALKDSDIRYLAGLENKELLYCQNCGQCVSDCQKHLSSIPTLMRAYMYNYGYRQPGLSKETLAELHITGSECSGCSKCTVKCPSGFNVASKIAAITPIIHVPDSFLA
jgi:predicted aldo/keto reductase-like oxidoreductase